jgi:hypothetical protein
MPENPVQTILNADRFVRSRDIAAGGGNKDFFEGHDAAFCSHRDELSRQINAMRNQLVHDQFGGIAFAKVNLQRSALAKSHRPLQAVFPPTRTPVVGSAGVGSIIIEVTPEALTEVEAVVNRAESSPRVVENSKTGQTETRPSRARSEVGAISQLEMWSPSDRRTFSAREAIGWLSDLETGGGYIVETFWLPKGRADLESMPIRRRNLFRSFEQGLRSMGSGVRVEPLDDATCSLPALFIRLEESEGAAYVQLMPARMRNGSRQQAVLDLQLERHHELLQFLDRHPLVRAVRLPPKVVRSSTRIAAIGEPFHVPKRVQGSAPRIGVIDGGVSDVLSPWVVERYGLLAGEDRDESHGTFIGGLLVGGATSNGHCAMEPDGCDIVDIDLFPVSASFGNYYPKGVSDFFDEIEAATVKCRTAYGVRIFNLSLNLTSPATTENYDYFASRLDTLADRYDVVFVISAGNMSPNAVRSEWSNDPEGNLALLATSKDDNILTPAESVRNVSVGALNPPGHSGCIAFSPAAYTRRGPGLRSGVKPDFAHIGGALCCDPTLGHGLISLLPSGEAESSCGTSYAAPLIAKILAQLDYMIEGEVCRETLLALVAHSARIPEPLNSPSIRPVARDLVGFGKPASASEILVNDDHEITLVFESRLLPNTELVFPFSWPTSLVDHKGACRGQVRMTLVSTPPLDLRYGAEYVRINLDAALQQETSKGYRSKLAPAFLPEQVTDASEKDLIDNALKWGAVKTYEGRFPRGVGQSSNWRLRVDYLARSLETMPSEGVPFSLVLSIADPVKMTPIFSEVRQSI